MPQFRYIAVTHNGQKVPGTLLAASRSDALQLLSGQMLMPVSLSEQSMGSAQRERVSPAAMSVAYSLLSDQLETGVPLLRALQVMAESVATEATTQPGPAGGVLIDDPAFAAKLADVRIRTEVLEILEYRVLATVAEGKNPGAASSMLKVDLEGNVLFNATEYGTNTECCSNTS